MLSTDEVARLLVVPVHSLHLVLQGHRAEGYRVGKRLRYLLT